MGSIIKVNEYKDFGNNDIMTSDGAGNVTVNADGLKNVPAFVAFKTSSTQSIPNTTNTKVLFEGEQLDTASVYDTSNSRFTPGVAGYYFIGAKWRYDSNTNFGDARFMLYINGSEKITIACVNDNSNGMTFSTVVYATASDYFEMYAKQDSGGSVDINGGSTYLSDSTAAQFYGFRIIGA